MNRLRIGITIMALFVTLGVGVSASARADAKLPDEQKAVLQQLGVNNFNSIIVDSAMTYAQAMGDNVVPPEGRAIHAVMKPHLRVVPVVYWGLSSKGLPDHRIHVGQIVVHKSLVQDTNKLFLKMFQLRFPVHSVIPESAFGYNDQQSMAANNSSNYRPEDGSEHGRGSAFDINPFQNPFDLTGYDPTRPVEPTGAVYDPSKPGTIIKMGALRQYATSLHWEWGGGWGDPNAIPSTDFFREGYFDYQHFQLDYTRYATFNAQLPACMQDWTCQ